MRSKFGWDLPLGVTQRHIDEAFGGDDHPCECCGHDPADCICPECPTCHEQGNPVCYDKDKGGIRHSSVEPMKYNREQLIGQAKMRIAAWHLHIEEEQQYIQYLEQGGESE